MAFVAQAQRFEKYTRRLDEAFIQGDIKEASEQYFLFLDRFARNSATFSDSIDLQYY